MSIWEQRNTNPAPNEPKDRPTPEVTSPAERLRDAIEEARNLPEASAIAAHVAELAYERISETLGMLAETASHVPADRDLGAAQAALGIATHRLARFIDRNRPLLNLDEGGVK